MAAIMSTMFVTPPPKPPSFLQKPARSAQKPLAPISTLAESHSCSHLGQSSPSPRGISAASSVAALISQRGALPARDCPQGQVQGQEDNDTSFETVPLSPGDGPFPYSCPLWELFRTNSASEGEDSPANSDIFTTPKSTNSPLNESPYSRAQRSSQRAIVDCVFDRNPARARGAFRPQRAGRGTSSYQLRQYAEATLGSQSLRKVVKLPEGEDINEWLAVNVVDFYNQINLLYGSITEFCSPQTCPEMKATDEFEYLWQDSENFKRPTKMPAPEYIEHLMAWCQSNIDNEQLFPSRIGVPFPKSFPSLIRQMFKRLYRVYAHIYCHHYPVIIHLGLEPHLNTSFKHYVLFIEEHQLATGKDFWGPLGDLVESMLKSD